MKKVVLSLALFASVIAVVAQPRAIGGRFTYGLEASYQHSLGSNMLQLDAGFHGGTRSSGIHAVGTYNWLFPISAWKHDGSWNWYLGLGAGVGLGWWWGDKLFWGYNSVYYNSRAYGSVGVAGMVGVEYNFKFPLQLSVDYRPLIGIGFSGDGSWFDRNGLYSIAVGVRYKF